MRLAQEACVRLQGTFAKLASPAGLLIAMALSLATIGALLAAALSDSYREQLRNAEQHASNLATALSGEVRQEMQSLDSSLLAAVEGWKDPHVAALDERLRKLVMFDRSATRQGVGSIYIVAADGTITLQPAAGQSQLLNLSERSYFRVHRDQPEAGLVVSEPIRSKVDGQWFIGLSRRLENADGSFGGIVFASIMIDHLREMYERLSVGRLGAMMLMRIDGKVVVRSPFQSEHVGRDLRSFMPVDAIGRSQGSFEAVSPIDGQVKIIAFRRIGQLPYLQMVSLSKDEVLAPWWRKTTLILAGFAFVSLVIGALTWLVVLELRRRMAAEAKLALAARTDPLTGLGNRRRFDDALSYEWQRATKSRGRLAVLMIDVDHFKAYNDTHGHAAGDAALKRVAECLANRVRQPVDVVARYGGEEFVIILPDATAERAIRIARLIQKDIAAAAIAHAALPSDRLTVSIGVAAGEAVDFRSALDLFEQADKAVYRAKHAGRNRIESTILPRKTEKAA